MCSKNRLSSPAGSEAGATAADWASRPAAVGLETHWRGRAETRRATAAIRQGSGWDCRTIHGKVARTYVTTGYRTDNNGSDLEETAARERPGQG